MGANATIVEATMGPDQDPVIRVYQVPVERIGQICSLMEASDNLGVIRTLDRFRGIVEAWVAPDMIDGFEALLAGLRREFPMQELPHNFD